MGSYQKNNQPTNGAISPEAKRKWLDFVEFVNEGLARPYTPSAIGNRIFEIGADNVASKEHRSGWRDWVRKQLLSVQTQHRTRLTFDDLTAEEEAAIRKYCATTKLTPGAQALLDAHEAKQKTRKTKEQ